MALIMFTCAMTGAFGSCGGNCRVTEVSVQVNHWSGQPATALSGVLRVGYQYRIRKPGENLEIYRDVTELAALTTDKAGRFKVSRPAEPQFAEADPSTLKASLAYGAKKGGDLILEPSRARTYEDDGVCGVEYAFVLRQPAAVDPGFVQRRLRFEAAWAKDQGREVSVINPNAQ